MGGEPNTTPEFSTEELVAMSCRGDRLAYGRLVQRYQQGVYAFVLGRCADPDRAQELTQAAFVTGFVKLKRLEKPGSFRSWVIGIAQNLLRRRRNELADGELLEGASDGSEDGLSKLAHMERIEAVHKAMGELPETYRVALTLHYFDRQSGRDIGAVLGVSEGGVHMILLRARRALAQKLRAFAP